jgi:hypothetical protein
MFPSPDCHQRWDSNDCSFFEEAGRIAAADYIPVEADVLRARTKTTGIYETRFTMGSLSIQSVFCINIMVLVANCMVVCSMLAGREVKERNGFIALRMLPRSSSVLR